MNRIIEIEVLGTKYVSISEKIHGGCDGCVFNTNDNIHPCDISDMDIGGLCYPNSSIFELEGRTNMVGAFVQKYTIEDVIETYVDLYGSIGRSFEEVVESINKSLVDKSDPEYADFLRLKEKFK